MEHPFDIPELLVLVLSYIDRGSDYKSVCAVSTILYRAARDTHPRASVVFANQLAALIKMFPDKPWDWNGMSRNPNTTWDIVVANPDRHWSWYGMSWNPNITWDIVVATPKHWDWTGLSQNPSITWDIIVANPDKPWDWINMSRNTFGDQHA